MNREIIFYLGIYYYLDLYEFKLKNRVSFKHLFHFNGKSYREIIKSLDRVVRTS